MVDVFDLSTVKIIVAVLVVLYIAYNILPPIAKWVFKVLQDTWSLSKYWIVAIVIILGALLFSFHLIIGAAWYLTPGSLDITLNPDTHEANIDFSFTSIQGTYTESDTGFVMTPSWPSQLPLVPKIYIYRTANNHVSISRFSFNQTQKIVKIPLEPNPGDALTRYKAKKVYIFTPDRI